MYREQIKAFNRTLLRDESKCETRFKGRVSFYYFCRSKFERHAMLITVEITSPECLTVFLDPHVVTQIVLRADRSEMEKYADAESDAKYGLLYSGFRSDSN